jgi:hypothetical protein
LLQVETWRIGVGPQRLQVMTQPPALLLVLAGDKDARGHARAAI